MSNTSPSHTARILFCKTSAFSMKVLHFNGSVPLGVIANHSRIDETAEIQFLGSEMRHIGVFCGEVESSAT